MKGFVFAFFLLMTGSVFAQYTLEAVVLDGMTRQPIVNANVYLDGTTRGTTTDAQGKFRITVPEIINTSLVVSFIGYEKKMIHNPFQSLPPTLFLEEHVEGINEVTVQGKFNKRKRREMLELFRKYFFGDRTDVCKILNEKDLLLSHDMENMVISASAHKPLEIINNYLKYFLRMDLIEFKIYLSSNEPPKKEKFQDVALPYTRQRIENPLLQIPVDRFSYKVAVQFTDVGGNLKTLKTRRETDYYQSFRYFLYLLGNNQIKDEEALQRPRLVSLVQDRKKRTFYDQDSVFVISKSQSHPSMKTIAIRPEMQDNTTGYYPIEVTYKPLKQLLSYSITFYNDMLHIDTYGNEVKFDLNHNYSLDGDFNAKSISRLLPRDYMPSQTEQTMKTPLTTATPKENIPDNAVERIRYYMEKQALLFPQEIIYLHTDKTHYVAGETLWFRAYLTDYTTNTPSVQSRYVYGEMYDPADSLVLRIKIHQDSVGIFKGYFDLPPNLTDGNYRLRFYTRYMEEAGEDFFCNKQIYIGNPFSILHSSGEIPGNNATIIPEVELPTTKTEIVGLNVVQSDDAVHVEALVSDSLDSGSIPVQDSLYLLIHCRGAVCGIEQLAVGDKRSYSKEDLPSGVIHLLLLNGQLKPLCERFIFNRNDNDLIKVSVTPSLESYRKREQVELSIELTTCDDDQLQDGFSVSVAFSDSEPPARVLYPDSNMLFAQEKSRYNMTDLMEGYYKKSKTLPELASEISGQISFNKLQSSKTGQYVKINAAGVNHRLLPETITEVEDNNFELAYNAYPNGTTYTLQASPSNFRSMNPNVTVFPKNSKRPRFAYNLEPSTVESFRSHISQTFSPYKADWERFQDEVLMTGDEPRGISPFSPGRKQDKVVTRLELGKNKKMTLQQLLSTFDNMTVKSDENGILHIRYMNEGSYYDYVVIVDDRWMNANALSLFDPDFENIRDNGLENLLSLTVDQIEEIEIIPAPAPPIAMSAFGNLVVNDPVLYDINESLSPISALSPRRDRDLSHPGYMGTILITTTARNAGITNAIKIAPLGYQVSRHFYAPVYKTKEQKENSAPDKRTTLYWNPDVQTDDNGQAKISFYTADTAADYTVTIEGITKQGALIRQTTKIRVSD